MTLRGMALLVALGALAVVGALYLLDAPSGDRLVIQASNNVIINIGVHKPSNPVSY